MFAKIKDYLAYKNKPKYVIMKGSQIDNRAIMWLGIGGVYSKDDDDNVLIEFENRSNQYYASNIYEIIWSHKELRRWRKILGRKNSRCLQQISGRWERI